MQNLLVPTSQLIGVLHVFTILIIGRAFTPLLDKFYTEINKDGKQIEIIFVSFDKDLEQYNEYCQMMPWKSLPFADSKIEPLAVRMDVTGIPRLIIMKPNGKIIRSDARSEVVSNGTAAINEWLKV